MRRCVSSQVALSLIATLVTGCDEPRRTLASADVVTDLMELSEVLDAPSDEDAALLMDRPEAAPDEGPVDVTDVADAADAPTHAADAGTDATLEDRPDVTRDAGPDAATGARGTPVVDGMLGADWPDGALVAVNPEPSPWGPALNALRSLRVAWDDDRLYLGIEGVIERQNAIVVYIDRDYVPGAAATGVSRFSTLSDGAGALDDALSSAIESVPQGFGAELAWGTLGMLRKGAAEVRADVGLRDIACPRCAGDFGWVQGDAVACVAGPAGGCEVSIPWSAVFGASGRPPLPRLGLFVRLTNATGATFAPGQCLPPQGPSAPAAVTSVLALSPQP